MPGTSLTLSQLAKYIHLPEKQVQKLVDRGSIPGRKVNGEWIFSREEVHRWLETRIGASDDQELAVVEGALARSAGTNEENEVLIRNFIFPETIRVPLIAKTKDSVLRSMTALAMESGRLWDADMMADALKKREDLHPTALDNGVALLHPRRPMPSILGESFIALGITPTGIPFGGGFGNLTDIFFLLGSQDDRIHLRILARLSRVITFPGFLEKLRESTDANEIIELISETEESIK